MKNYEANPNDPPLMDWLEALPPDDAAAMRDILAKMHRREETEVKLFGMNVVATDALPPDTALILSEDVEHPGQINPKNCVLIKFKE